MMEINSRKEYGLSARESDILRSIVNLYILKAAPVGSRPLAKFLEGTLTLSPASIRNIMSDLEEQDFISHPHTSAGRVPTDKGYRYYVDTLMEMEKLSERESTALQDNLGQLKGESETVLREAGKLLGALSQYLGIVRIPDLRDLIVMRAELIPLGGNNMLVVLALDSNIVRTVTLEASFDLDMKYLNEVTSYINERISGRPMSFLRENFARMMSDMDGQGGALIRLFVDSVDQMFKAQNGSDKIFTTGAQNMLSHPEFEDLGKVRSIIELIENEDIIIHLLDSMEDSGDKLRVLIGSEMESGFLENYSVVLSSYRFGSATGHIGLIGPKRMNYSRMMSLVSQVSHMLS